MTIGTMHIIDQTSGKPRPLTLETTAGKLSVDASGSTVPVSGTFYQATQPVSLASSVAVTGTFFQATQPVSIAGTVSTSGTLAVSKNKAALNTATSVSADDFSTHHDVSNYNKVAVAGTHTGSGNIELWVSDDNSTYYKAAEHDMYPDGDNAFYKYFDAPFKYYKLKYKGAGTASAEGYAST